MKYTLVFCLCFLFSASLWADSDSVGEITWVEGSVKIEYPSKPQEDAKIGKNIGINATMITGENSKVVIRLTDGTILSVAPKTKIMIESLIKSIDKREGSVLVFFGKVRAIVKKQVGSKSKFEFKSKTAIAGVRGTHLALDVQEDGTTKVLLISGFVGVFNRDKMDLPEIMLSDMTYSEIKENQAPTPPAIIPPEMLKDLYANTSILGFLKEDIKKSIDKKVDVAPDTRTLNNELEQGLLALLKDSQQEVVDTKSNFSKNLAEPLREQDIQGVVAPRDFTGSVDSRKVDINIRVDTSNY